VKFYVYITTNPNRDALYVGMTQFRAKNHRAFFKRGRKEIHAGKYYCYKLVFFEEYKYVNAAISREKEIKKWRGKRKKRWSCLLTLIGKY